MGFCQQRKLVKFPFKFPALGAKEIRANVLYTGLCHTDVLVGRAIWGETIFPIAQVMKSLEKYHK